MLLFTSEFCRSVLDLYRQNLRYRSRTKGRQLVCQGAFHSTKITCSNFRSFRWSNGTHSDGFHFFSGETLLCLKMADFLNIFAVLEHGDCETISCTILDSSDDVILLAAVACFLRRELTRVNGYNEITIPVYMSGEFENHFRMTRETFQLLTQEIKQILPEKQILLFLWSVANREPHRTIADAR